MLTPSFNPSPRPEMLTSNYCQEEMPPVDSNLAKEAIQIVKEETLLNQTKELPSLTHAKSPVYTP